MRRMGCTADGDVTAFAAARDQRAVLGQTVARPFGGQHDDHVADVGASVQRGEEELGGGAEGELMMKPKRYGLDLGLVFGYILCI